MTTARPSTLLAALGAALLLTAGSCSKSSGPSEPAPLSAARFTEVAKDAGLSYKWEIPGKRPLNILQTIGNGAAFLDFDNDGNQDILLVGPKTALFQGDGKGKFADVSKSAGLEGLQNHLGVAVGDYDNDGFPDVYLTAYKGGALLHNEGGKSFKDVTPASGIGAQPWGTVASFADVDLDGKLDLYIGNYADFGPDKDQLCPQQGIPTSCGPRHYTPIPGILLKNAGAGKFVKLPLPGATGRNLGVGAAPLGETGHPTLALANDEIPGDLMVPEKGTYKNTAPLAGTAYDKDGNVHGGMGTDWGDFDGDGKLDLFVATFENEVKCLYRNEGEIFSEVSATSLLAAPTRPWVAFGCKFLDFDNDGNLDLAIANGHVQDNIEQIEKGVPYRQTTQLLRNKGGERPTFDDLSASAGAGFQKPVVGRGMASGDYDNDGKRDLLVVDSEGEPLLLHNDSTAGNWLGLRVLTGGRDAYGALVTVTVGGKKLVRHVHADGSYMSSSDPRIHVGLGTAQKPDSIEIRWPSGKKTTLADVPAGKYVMVKEETGKIE